MPRKTPSIEDRARADLARVERRRRMLAEAEARLRATCRDYGDATGLYLVDERVLRRELSNIRIAA